MKLVKIQTEEASLKYLISQIKSKGKEIEYRELKLRLSQYLFYWVSRWITFTHNKFNSSGHPSSDIFLSTGD